MTSEPLLFLWFDREPETFEPDLSIQDTPGAADIDLLTAAIIDGKLGDILPSRIYMSNHRNPQGKRSVRTVDVGRLLRDIGVQHRRCYQITLPDHAATGSIC